MLRRIDNTKMGSSDLGWLKSKFHFSFAEYYNPFNLNFGTLRVIWARKENKKIIPLCPYSKAQMEKNEEYRDMIY